MSRLPEYLAYHRISADAGDIDPSYAMIRYVADRFELNVEQRYWMAWLYAMSYCGATTFYWYNEFPDYENVDVGRMERWWRSRGREETIVQTDRRWVRSSNMFVPAFESYRAWIGDRSQEDAINEFTSCSSDPQVRYDRLYECAKELYSFGQFALFLYLEALHTITDVNLCPTNLDLDKAWSCRNGLYYAWGRDDLVEDVETRIRPGTELETEEMWTRLREELSRLESPPTVWQTETILCAYRKYHRGKRYLGYYLDRQASEIAKMADRVVVGVCWSVLWQYREETYEKMWLAEKHDLVDERGVDKMWRRIAEQRTRNLLREAVQ